MGFVFRSIGILESVAVPYSRSIPKVETPGVTTSIGGETTAGAGRERLVRIERPIIDRTVPTDSVQEQKDLLWFSTIGSTASTGQQSYIYIYVVRVYPL